MEEILRLKCGSRDKVREVFRTALKDLDDGPSGAAELSREELYRLFWRLDEILDNLTSLAIRVLAFDLIGFPASAATMAGIVESCGNSLREVVQGMENNEDVAGAVARIHALQADARDALLQGMTGLFKSGHSPVELMKLHIVYELLDRTVSSFDNAARTIEDIQLDSGG